MYTIGRDGGNTTLILIPGYLPADHAMIKFIKNPNGRERKDF